MQPATIQKIKEELSNLPQAKLMELCLRLAKYKKDNKELLSYLLFEAHDEDAFVTNAKDEIDESFSEINTANAYFIKKSLRKILRTIGKYAKHTASKQAELEMLIHFCRNIKSYKIPYQRITALKNIYDRQIKKIDSLVPLLHEDLQYDYMRAVLELGNQ